MSKHTPGPWRISEERPHCIVADSPIPGISGNDDLSYYGGNMVAESIAPQNTALVAAAPDLLAALEAMVFDNCWGCPLACDGDNGCSLIRIARVAIAKAKGE